MSPIFLLRTAPINWAFKKTTDASRGRHEKKQKTRSAFRPSGHCAARDRDVRSGRCVETGGGSFFCSEGRTAWRSTSAELGAFIDFQVSQEVKAKLERRAAREHRTVSQFLRMLVESAVQGA